jgi:hypothetical protein
VSRRAWIVAVACLAVAGCEDDPARSVKILARPVPASDGSSRPAAAAEFAWRPELCPPPAEGAAGPGALVATGACPFTHHGAVECTTLPDDLILETSRPAARGATLSIYLNVEKYHGPGVYDEAQMLVSVQDGTSLFRWRSDEVVLTVGEDGRHAELTPVRLEALPPFDETEITVGGTLWCSPAGGGSASDG